MLLVMGVADGLARLLEPWSSLYRNNPAVQTTLTFLHLAGIFLGGGFAIARSEEHTSELQSHSDLVCRLLLEKKKRRPLAAVTMTGIAVAAAACTGHGSQAGTAA